MLKMRNVEGKEMLNQSNSNELIANQSSTGLLSTFHRKRRHTFDVDLKVERVLSLPYANGKFFFKIRLLNGGNHLFTSPQRFEVNENKVEFNITDHFSVKMTSRLDNFTLDHCYCRISIRKEGRAGRSYEKIGFYDLDLASVAGCGDESKACLLNAYQQTNTNPANAYLEIRMKLTVLQGDHIFRRPDSAHPLMKIDPLMRKKKFPDTLNDEYNSTKTILLNEQTTNSSSTSTNPSNSFIGPTTTMTTTTTTNNFNPVLIRGHSRQASKSSVCSNYSTTSVNSTNCPSNQQDKTSLKTTSDEENHQQAQKRFIQKRRTPFIEQFGDIQRRLQSTRVDVTDIVNSVMNNPNQRKPMENSNGYLCLMYNEDGTARVGSSSSSHSIHQSPQIFLSN